MLNGIFDWFKGIPLLPIEISWVGSPLFSFVFEIWVGILGYFAFQEFKQYRRKQRAEAASKILASVRACIDFINEIAARPSLYEYEDYYPTRIPEIASREKELQHFPERPSRLIANRVSQMKAEINEPLILIAGKDGRKVANLTSELYKKIMNLSNLIGARGDEYTREIILSAFVKIDESKLVIDEFEKVIFEILSPIIEGKSYTLIFCEAIKGWFNIF